jgi:hypothetical protein
MAPVAIGLIAVAAASSLAQLYNSERERGATKQRLAQIQKMFDEIVPPEYDISVYDDPELVKTIPPAAFDYSRITPESFEVVGQYVPEVAEFVREVAPEVVEASAAAQEGRGAQLEALRRYRDIAAGQTDPLFQQKMQEASDRARIEAQGRIGATLQDAQRRGALDSGVQLAAQLQGGSDAMTRGALASQAAAAEAYRNQLMALDRSASLGGDIRASEMGEAARNTGIINDFNQRTSANYQNYVNQRANMANQAQVYNLDRAQSINDANVAQRNKFTVDNLNRYNQLLGQKYEMENKARADKLAIQARKEQLMQQNYNNQMAQTGARAGVQYNINDAMNQATRDRNQAIQGLGEGIMGGMMYGAKNPEPKSPDEKPTYSTSGYMPQTQGQAPYSPYTPNMSPKETTAYAPYETDFTFDEYLRRKGQ